MLFAMKLFLWFLLGFFAFWLLRRLHSSARGADQRPTKRGQFSGRMVECAYCGLNFPLEESIQRRGLHYCSQDHLREAIEGDKHQKYDG